MGDSSDLKQRHDSAADLHGRSLSFSHPPSALIGNGVSPSPVCTPTCSSLSARTEQPTYSPTSSSALVSPVPRRPQGRHQYSRNEHTAATRVPPLVTWMDRRPSSARRKKKRSTRFQTLGVPKPCRSCTS